MTTRIQKWGNSLAVRIPRAFAEEIGLCAQSEVDLSPSAGTLILKPLRPARPTLDELLAGVTEENRHPEVQTGPSVGKEQW
jgi:antitoxin MazE